MSDTIDLNRLLERDAFLDKVECALNGKSVDELLAELETQKQINDRLTLLVSEASLGLITVDWRNRNSEWCKRWRHALGWKNWDETQVPGEV